MRALVRRAAKCAQFSAAFNASGFGPIGARGAEPHNLECASAGRADAKVSPDCGWAKFRCDWPLWSCAVHPSNLWQHDVATSAATPILGNDMSLLDEDDLVVLCKLKPFPSKLQRKWVQGLVAEQRAAAFMKDASAAKNHSTSPPLEDKGAEDEDEEENGDEDADADEDEDSDEEDKEVHGGAAGERGAGDGKSDEDVCIIDQQSTQHHKEVWSLEEEDGKRTAECVNDAAAGLV